MKVELSMGSIDPIRLAFFQECVDAFDRGIGCAGRGTVGRANTELREQWLADRFVQQLFGKQVRVGGALGAIDRQLLTAGPYQIITDDFVKQPQLLGRC